MLDAKALHAAAKGGEGVPPEFARANAAVETARRAAEDATFDRHQLIREARQIGIPWVALARWTGMNVRTLHEIVEDK
jgi:hypothetical protein